MPDTSCSEPLTPSQWRVRVLTGHVSPETAYRVEDYPYGRVLRCRIRYWIETATKGSAKGQQRFMSQTTNPKQPGEVWNKPKASTYSEIRVLYLDSVDHVQSWAVSLHLSPVEDARIRLHGIHEQLTEQDRSRYDTLLTMSHGYAEQWEEWEEKIDALARHIQETGTDPELINWVWTAPTQKLYYLGEYDVPVYLAMARQRLSQVH